MIDPDKIDAYFLDVATRLVALQHTAENKRFAYNIDELKKGIGSGVPCIEPTLILDEPQGSEDYTGDHWIPKNNHGFWVLKKVEKENWAQENVAVKECNVIAKKILAKMKYEFKTDADTIMRFLDPDSIAFQKAGPEVNNLFGVYYSYRFHYNDHVVYDAADYVS